MGFRLTILEGMPVLALLSEALRERRRDWRVTVAFAVVLGTALAVAIACTSLAWPLLWEPLPYPNADHIAAIHSIRKGVEGGVSWVDADDLRERVPSIDKVAVYSARTWGVQTEQDGHVEVVLSAMATGDFFEVLGVRPALGAIMTPAHDVAVNQNEVWLTNAVAARLFGRSEASLNRTLWINAARYRVTGVLPASFRFPMAEGAPDLVIPLARGEYCCTRGGGGQSAIARLRNPAGFGAELNAASNVLSKDFPATNAELRFVHVPLREHLFGARRIAVRWILLGALCLVLTAAANASGIWMARWLKVRRDAAIRISLGASALQLGVIRAMEGAVTGWLAGALGVALAAILFRVLDATPGIHQRLESFAVWRPVSLVPFAIAGSLIAGLTLGITAALLPHLAVMARLLREGTRESMSVYPATRRVRLVLTAVQLSVTAILSWTSIAIGENVYTLLTAPQGFETAQTLIAGIGVPEARYDTDEKMTAFHAAVIAQLEAVPGVSAAAGGAGVPQTSTRTRFLRDGQTVERAQQPVARIGIASPGLLRLLSVPVRRGRAFTVDDRWGAPRVAMVNEAFVRTYLSDTTDPLREGLRLGFYNGFSMKPYTRFQIVGVFANTRNDALLAESQPQVLIPSTQIAMEGFFYYVKTSLPSASINNLLREAVWSVDPAMERVTFRPLDDYLERGLADRRASGLFGIAVVLVAAVIVITGLYASLSASLLESAKEFAIRAALGATPARLAKEALNWAILAAVLSFAVATVAVPIVAASVQLEKAALYPTTASVMLTLLVMGIVIATAAIRPAWKAATTPPAGILRMQ